MVVAFTGGPSAGKTAVLDLLKEKVSADYAGKIVFVPEAFGILYQDIPKRFKFILRRWRSGFRQYLIARVTASMIRLAQSADPDTIVITDRGFWDVEVYCRKKAAAFITAACDVPEYDACVYLEPPEDMRNLKSDTKTMRQEKNYSEIRALAERTRPVWKAHTPPDRFFSFPQFPTVEEKAAAVAKKLNAFIGEKVFEV